MHHVIDPATGLPACTAVSAVIVQANEAWWAEGIAKAALVAGADKGFELLERLGLAAVVVADDGGRRTTRHWERA
jgi:thiamine biosynthesis lipoprotein